MTKPSDDRDISVTTIVRRFIFLAYAKHPSLQPFAFSELDRKIREKSLEDTTQLHIPGCTINLVLGGRKLAIMSRLHDDPDPLAQSKMVTINRAIETGQIVLMPSQVAFPAQSIPSSVLVPFAAKVDGYVRRQNRAPSLGEILDIDPEISAVRVIHVNVTASNSVILRVNEDSIGWSQWVSTMSGANPNQGSLT